MSQQENANELIGQIEQEEDIYEILKLWEQNYNSLNFDPEPFVRRLAEIFQVESSKYMLKDPDPFDERHPSRTDPTCDWGKNLKTLFKKENFMTR
jgi:HIV-1 Vpr-binding protein